MMNVIDISKNNRLKSFFESKGLSQKEFAEKIGASQQYISAVVNCKRNVGANLIERIKIAYSDFDEYWFLTGEGDMILKDKPNVSTPANKTIENLEYTIEVQKKLIENLENQLKNK